LLYTPEACFLIWESTHYADRLDRKMHLIGAIEIPLAIILNLIPF
jgi:hypothetical protein